MDRRLDLLSERQKEVLRLALTMTSDEIAAALNRAGETAVTAKAVNNRIDAAREKLGGMPRRQAAELLAAAEGRLIDPGRSEGEKIPNMKIPMAEPVSAAPATAIGAPPAPNSGRRRNDLDIWQRLGLILLMMSGFAAAAGLYIFSLRLR